MVLEIEVWRVSQIRVEEGGRGGPEFFYIVVGNHCLCDVCFYFLVSVDRNDRSACCLRSKDEKEEEEDYVVCNPNPPRHKIQVGQSGTACLPNVL
jgi:hypothetical protein